LGLKIWSLEFGAWVLGTWVLGTWVLQVIPYTLNSNVTIPDSKYVYFSEYK